MEKESLIHGILEDFPVLVCVMEMQEPVVLYCNNMARQYIGDHITDGRLDQACGLIAHDMPPPVAGSGPSSRYEYAVTLGRSSFLLSNVRARWTGGRDVRILVGVDITESKKSEAELIASANIDRMTGIYNRNAGIDFLEKYVAEVNRNGDSFTVCYLDLNDLKHVNDTFGHAAGDQYILTVVSVIKHEIRHSDIFARMGGDEFLIIFPHCPRNAVEDIARVITHKLDVISGAGILECAYSISYGILYVGAGVRHDVEQVLNAVDRNMYYMKEEYRKTKANSIAAIQDRAL